MWQILYIDVRRIFTKSKQIRRLGCAPGLTSSQTAVKADIPLLKQYAYFALSSFANNLRRQNNPIKTDCMGKK